MANWRIESLGRDSESQSDEEFFDCEGSKYFLISVFNRFTRASFSDIIESSLAKWSSMDLLTEEDPDAPSSLLSQINNQGTLFFMSKLFI